MPESLCLCYVVRLVAIGSDRLAEPVLLTPVLLALELGAPAFAQV